MSIHPALQRAERLLPLLLWALLLPQPAQAHRLYVFARSENGQICAESYYSKRSKASGALITVRDGPGKLLLQGQTDAAGRFCFTRPGYDELIIAVNAEQGHRGEFKLPARKSAAASPASQAHEAPDPLLAPSPADDPASSLPAGEHTLLSRELLQSLIREELQRSLPLLLERNLSAIFQAEAAQKEKDEAEPSLRDIAGGLGWIAGLAALFALCRSRRAS